MEQLSVRSRGNADDIRNNRDDIEAFLSADLDFHLALAEATENAVIAEMTKLVIDQVHRHHASFASTLLSARAREDTLRSARQVIDHVKAGDAARAAESMRRHLRAVSTELRQRVYLPAAEADQGYGL